MRASRSQRQYSRSGRHEGEAHYSAVTTTCLGRQNPVGDGGGDDVHLRFARGAPPTRSARSVLRAREGMAQERSFGVVLGSVSRASGGSPEGETSRIRGGRARGSRRKLGKPPP